LQLTSTATKTWLDGLSLYGGGTYAYQADSGSTVIRGGYMSIAAGGINNSAAFEPSSTPTIYEAFFPVTFANLPTPGKIGRYYFCVNCNITSPLNCTGGSGGGALAIDNGAGWICK